MYFTLLNFIFILDTNFFLRLGKMKIMWPYKTAFFLIGGHKKHQVLRFIQKPQKYSICISSFSSKYKNKYRLGSYLISWAFKLSYLCNQNPCTSGSHGSLFQEFWIQDKLEGKSEMLTCNDLWWLSSVPSLCFLHAF